MQNIEAVLLIVDLDLKIKTLLKKIKKKLTFFFKSFNFFTFDICEIPSSLLITVFIIIFGFQFQIIIEYKIVDNLLYQLKSYHLLDK